MDVSRDDARLNVVVLVSGTGTLLQSLIDAVEAGEVNARVVAVVSDSEGAPALERARRHGIEAIGHPYIKGSDRAGWDQELAEIVAAFEPGLVVSAGFMKLLGGGFLARHGGRTVNTHPSLLPSFPGMRAAQDALAAGVKVTGATVFLVDEGIDTGRILVQAAVEVMDGDDAEVLHERIKIVERELLVRVVREWKPGES